MIRNVFNLVFIMLVGFSCTDKVTKQPNVLIILTDDQGYGDFAFQGNEVVRTPHLDQLASESMVFERFYVSPVCAPTRSSLLTGRYHLSTGTRWVTHREEVMKSSEVTIAELLNSNGYRTGLFGKWHNGKQYPHNPMGQGFDTFFGFTEGHLNNYFDATVSSNFDKVATEGYLPDVLTDQTISFIKEEEPFMAMLSFNTPHSPFQVSDQYFAYYKAKGLDDKDACVYGMVENIDDNIGKLLTALEASGKSDNTILIFLSDNGPNGVRYNANLKGIKSHVDEGGVRTACLMRYPNGEWDVRKVVSCAGAHIDLLPTIAELTDTQHLMNGNVHGRSLVPALEGKELEDRYFFTHQVIRQFDTIPGAVRKGDYLLTMKREELTLYNLYKDPFQKDNIAEDFPNLVSQYSKSYLDWFEIQTQEMGAKIKIQVGHDVVNEIEFPAPEVTNRLDVDFEGKEGWANDYIINWTDSTSAIWQYEAVAEQSYEVRVQMSGELSDPTNEANRVQIVIGGQVVQVIIDKLNVKQQVPSPDRVPRGEVYEYVWDEISLGTITIAHGLGQIELSTNSIRNTEVKSVILRKIKG